MHARFYNPQTGRFLGVDPATRFKPTANPQRWNRYAYGLNNPLKFIDPDGRSPKVYTHGQYKFVLDLHAHGGAHVDVWKIRGPQLARVSMATGELIPHMGKRGHVPKKAMSFMRAKVWIPALSGVVALAADILLNPSPLNASEPTEAQWQAMYEGRAAWEELTAQVAMDLFSGPIDPYGLTKEEQEQVTAEIERRADEQDRQRQSAEESLESVQSFSCWYTGIWPK